MVASKYTNACVLLPSITKECAMNKDQIKGKAKEVGGKIQEEAGKLVGSTKQQVKGLNKQSEGRMQKGAGDAEEVVKDTVKDLGNRQ
jgi:uncharacterized protein YjbJ (UPF0337 family)